MKRWVDKKQFELLTHFSVRKAPKLTVKSAQAMVRKCPALRALKELGKVQRTYFLYKVLYQRIYSLGGWDLSFIQYCKLQSDIEKENFAINLYYGHNHGR